MSEWISVKEQMPQYGIPVLVVYQGVVQYVVYTRDIGEWRAVHGDDCDAMPESFVTHWMPLPSKDDHAMIVGSEVRIARVRELEQALKAYFQCEIHEYGDDPEHNYCQCGWAKNNPVHCVSALQGTDKAAKNG